MLARSETRTRSAEPARDDLAAVVARQQTGVWRYLRALGCDPATADDLTQDAFLVLLRGFEVRSEAETAAFLRHTARHLFLRHAGRRRALRDVEATDRVWDARCADDAGAAWTDAVAACFDALTARARSALIACRVEDRDRDEVATELGLGSEGLKTLLRRALEQLRECIDRRTGEERDR